MLLATAYLSCIACGKKNDGAGDSAINPASQSLPVNQTLSITCEYDSVRQTPTYPPVQYGFSCMGISVNGAVTEMYCTGHGGAIDVTNDLNYPPNVSLEINTGIFGASGEVTVAQNVRPNCTTQPGP